MPFPSFEVTIYRRSESADDMQTFFQRLAEVFLKETIANDIVLRDFEGAQAMMILWRREPVPASWVEAATRLVGPLPDDYLTLSCGALLWVEVDEVTYVIGFGSGFRIIPDDFKDHGFGLGFTIRAVDADEVRGVDRRSMTGLGRQDATRVPGGIPIGHVGLSEYAELVRRLAGKVDPAELGLDGDRPVPVEGASGLRMHIPLDGGRLVALLRRISEICARKVRDEFAFIEAIIPVRDASLTEDLDKKVDDYLRNTLDSEEADTHAALAVPLEVTDLVDEARSFVVKVGGKPALLREPDLDAILDRWRTRERVPPLKALRRGEVRLCGDERGRESLGKTSADRWLAACTRVEDRDYFLIEGSWYESGAQYKDSVQSQITRLFAATPSVSLPPWPQDLVAPSGSKGRGEALYNAMVQDLLGVDRVLKLDRVMVPSPLHGRKGFEACDLLGPGNELIHVKAGKGTDPFSHLFNQALISTEALCLFADARGAFAERVHEVSGGARSLPKNWRPEKVVFAMMAKRQAPLTADTLFPHAQIALARMSNILRASYNVEVEVIPIPRRFTPPPPTR